MKKLFGVALLGMLVVLCSALRAEDKTFKPDDDGYIRNWLFLEPFPLTDKASDHTEDSQKEFFDKEFFPNQKKATPKDGDKVKAADTDVTWHAYAASEPVIKFDPKDNSMYLAVVYIVADADMPDTSVSIGSDDSSQWMVNGKEVKRVYAGRAVDKDQDKSDPFTLTKGVNVLYAAVINGGGETGLCARFLNKDGNPIKNVTVSLTPPAK